MGGPTTNPNSFQRNTELPAYGVPQQGATEYNTPLSIPHLNPGGGAAGPYQTPGTFMPQAGSTYARLGKLDKAYSSNVPSEFAGGGQMSSPFSSDIGAASPVSWEFFHAASTNNVKRLSELLGEGVDINQRDKDTGNTALIYAAIKGQKHALYYLVDQGADIDAQNNKGSTALHALVNNRYTNLSVWLVKRGADINVEDARGFTPYDMALPWLQKEMKEAVYGRKRIIKPSGGYQMGVGSDAEAMFAQTAMMKGGDQFGGPAGGGAGMGQLPPLPSMGASPFLPVPAGGGGMPQEKPRSGGGPVQQEVMKIYLKNNAYKSLLVTSDMKAGDVCQLMAEKLGMEQYGYVFDLIDHQKGQERRLDPNTNVFKVKANWPLILGGGGENVTVDHCRFVVVPKRGTSEEVQVLYRSALYGK